MSLQKFLEIYRDQNTTDVPLANPNDLIQVLDNVWTNKLGHIDTKGYCLTEGVIRRTSNDLQVCNNSNCIFCRDIECGINEVFNID